MDGLIGHTGFVGGTLMRQHDFGGRYNTSNIDQIAGVSFDTLVCAAAPGSMFEANRFPERDHARIDALIARLDALGPVRHFVLVSTVAVLAGFVADDEDTATFETETPYGVNRRRLELFAAERFPGALIVRLPALFGPGLKKNFLFDLMNPMPSMVPPAALGSLCEAAGANLAPLVERLYPIDPEIGLHVIERAALDASGQRAELERAIVNAGLGALRFTHPESRFQFYEMRNLWRDIARGLEHGLDVLHLAPPPLAAGDVYAALAGAPMPQNSARVHREDMRTRHAAPWGQQGPYIAAPDDVLQALRTFMAAERAAA